MSDFKIQPKQFREPMRSKNNLPENALFTLPKTANLAKTKEVFHEIKTIFSQFIMQGVPGSNHQIPTDEVLASLIHIGDGAMKSTQKKAAAVSDSEDLEPAVKEFAENLLENLKENYDSKLEPFEAYAQKVRSRIFANAKTFKKRFAEGYKVLLNELEKSPNSDDINHK